MTPVSVLYLMLGIALLAAAIVDIVWTTLWSDKGAGPFSLWVMKKSGQGLRRLASERSWALSLGEPLILVLTLVVWIGTIWFGWALLFAGLDTLVHARGLGPVTWSGRIDFVAQAMFTMGNGDFYPTSTAGQLATSLTTASGLLFVTLGIAYVISVLGGLVENRSFARNVMGIGTRGEAIIQMGWDDDEFGQFGLVLDTLSSDLGNLAAENKIYPILHYYRGEMGRDSAVLAIAVFDEALTLLRFGVPEEHHPNAALIEAAQANVESYLDAFTETFEPAEQTPPPPDLDRPRKAGIPTVSDEEFADALDDLQERRRLLLGIVEGVGWSWPSEETKENA